MPHLEPATAAWIALTLVAVGVASGVLAARRAARIEPAVSLRSVWGRKRRYGLVAFVAGTWVRFGLGRALG